MRTKFVILGIGLIFGVIISFLFIKSNVSSPAQQPVQQREPEAQVSLIEYSDFQCPACQAYYPVIKQLVTEFGDSLSFVYRHFPLRSTHFNAQIAAQAAEAAEEQGKFGEMHDLLFENQNEWAKIPDAKDLLEKYAQKIGLNLEQFRKDLESDKVKQEVEKDYQSGLLLGVKVTPTFFLNSKKLQNPRSLEEFRSIIQKELKTDE